MSSFDTLTLALVAIGAVLALIGVVMVLKHGLSIVFYGLLTVIGLAIVCYGMSKGYGYLASDKFFELNPAKILEGIPVEKLVDVLPAETRTALTSRICTQSQIKFKAPAAPSKIPAAPNAPAPAAVPTEPAN